MTLQEDDLALKILHTADWHLGLRFPAFDDADQLKLTRARLEVIDRILDQADAYAVDAVLCAGDQFDDPDPEPHWWEGLLKALNRASPRPIYLLPGNHDPLTPKSVYHTTHPFRQALPKWVHVVDRADFTAELSSDAVLYAAPCTSQAGDQDLALTLPDRQQGDARIRIGLVHGQTFDIPGYQTNFPIAPDAAIRRGLNYLAIGDTHSFRDVQIGTSLSNTTAPPVVYPGAPEPTRFGEIGAGQIAVVFFRRHGARPLVQPIRVGRWTWRDEACTDLAALRNLRNGDNLTTTVVRLVLDLTVSLGELEEVESILAELKGTEASHGRVGVVQVDRQNLRQAMASGDEFPEDLPAVLKTAVGRLQQHEDKVLANRALYHLFRIVRTERPAR